jgi:hypothetical protein
MLTVTRTITVDDLRAGDRFEADGVFYYEVTGPPIIARDPSGDTVAVPVRWADGGRGFRYFDSRVTTITVERP